MTRLFDNLVGMNENDFNSFIKFQIHYYKSVAQSNKKEILLQLKELRHDLGICDIHINELDQVTGYN